MCFNIIHCQCIPICSSTCKTGVAPKWGRELKCVLPKGHYDLHTNTENGKFVMAWTDSVFNRKEWKMSSRIKNIEKIA